MKTKLVNNALNYYLENQSELRNELLDFLRIPSISTSEAHQPDILLAADFLVKKLTQLGFEKVISFPTANHPIVYAEKMVDPQKPTVLIYGHYDVQPTDPLDEWNSPIQHN